MVLCPLVGLEFTFVLHPFLSMIWPLSMARLRSVLSGLNPPLHACHTFIAYLTHFVLSHASLIAYLSMFATLHVAYFST